MNFITAMAFDMLQFHWEVLMSQVSLVTIKVNILITCIYHIWRVLKEFRATNNETEDSANGRCPTSLLQIFQSSSIQGAKLL